MKYEIDRDGDVALEVGDCDFYLTESDLREMLENIEYFRRTGVQVSGEVGL